MIRIIVCTQSTCSRATIRIETRVLTPAAHSLKGFWDTEPPVPHICLFILSHGYAFVKRESKKITKYTHYLSIFARLTKV